ncbi:MAG: hypothetical protein CM15mP103_09660 [Gammaproteobacteria bacterium]|nr:MAG: hypothetical protein CM15mP103_09660 [Gammaproteobacteria bacterium]
MSQARCNYHHGDLRNPLIIAAAELIERDGTLDFDGRSGSQCWGSAAAPYRHFADKEELLRAVRDWRSRLWGMWQDTAAKHPAGSIDSVLAMGHTYLGYAREKRAFFSLMWEDRGKGGAT